MSRESQEQAIKTLQTLAWGRRAGPAAIELLRELVTNWDEELPIDLEDWMNRARTLLNKAQGPLV